MEQNLEHCKSCPSFNCHKTFVHPSGDITASVMVCGEGPGNSEVGRDKPFVGQSGALLWEKLCEIGFATPRDDLYVTNVVKCMVSSPSVKTVNHCAGYYLRQEINQMPNLKKILALGSPAYKFFNPKSAKGIMENTGKAFVVDIPPLIPASDNVTCLPSLHPAAVLRDPRKMALFRESLRGMVRDTPQTANPTYKITEDIRDLEKMKGKPISFDLETTGLDPFSCYVTHIGIYTGKTALIYPGKMLSNPNFIKALKACVLIGHNAKFDSKFIYTASKEWVYVAYDTMLMGYVKNESFGTDEDGGYALERLACLYLGVEKWKTPMKKKKFEVEGDEMYEYLARDVKYTYDLWKMWQADMGSFFHGHLIPLYNATAQMEYGGISIDAAYTTYMAKFATRRMAKLVKKLRKIGKTHKTYNPNSYAQNSKVFYEMAIKYKAPLRIRCDGKWFSVGKDTGAEVVDEYAKMGLPFFVVMQQYRKIQKLSSVYLTTKHVNKTTGKVHTSFKCHGTETGRLSSKEPNIQNVPKEARRLYIPDPGHEFFLSVDYKQLEIMVAVGMANLRELIEEINKGYDIHTVTAMKMTGLNPSDITSFQRRDAKEVNFGCLYGIGLPKLADLLKCSIEEAAAFKARYFGPFTEWKEKVESEAIRKRYVETIYGGRRRFDLITRRNYEEVKRQVSNTIIQGSAAQMAQERLTILIPELPKRFNGARVVNNVHDSIDATSPGGGIEREVAAYMKKVMEGKYFWTDMKFSVDIEIGKRWQNQKKPKHNINVDLGRMAKWWEMKEDK